MDISNRILTLGLLALALVSQGCVPVAAPDKPAAAGHDFDLQGFIDGQLAAGNKVITISPGRYRVTPHHGVHLRLNGFKDVTIIADGVEMVCTETTRAISIDDCENFTLRGLAIDYDPLPFTQGRITALAPDKSWAEFEIFDGYPDKVGQNIEIFDGHSSLLKRPTYYGWQIPSRLGPGRYRVSKAPAYVFDMKGDREEIGDIVVANSENAPGGPVSHAIVSDRCVNLRLEDVTVFASNCFSFFELNCDHSTYLRCRLVPRPAGDDPVPRAYRRLRSGNADAFHSKYARRGPHIIGCTAKFQGDDCVNICGAYYLVTSSSGKTLRLVLHQPLDMAAGNPVELVSYTGMRLPDARIAAVDSDGPVRAEERAFISAQHMDREIKTRLLAPDAKTVRLTLDREVSLPIGSVVASTERMGDGFLVQGCDFGFNRSRGILIKASNGQVLDNTITGTWGQAILVSPEWWWMESGSSNDLVIRDNAIRDCHETAVLVTARGGNGRVAPPGAHQNITLSQNRIERSPLPRIVVTSTSDLNVDHNEFPDLTSEERKSSAVRLESCVQVSGHPAP